jgi:hypothetical protein
MNFIGQQEFSETDLRQIKEKMAPNEGYLDRHYHGYVELNLRRVY